MRENIAEQIQALKSATLSTIQERYRELFNAAEAPCVNKPYLIKKIAYKLQKTAHGGLSDEAKARMAAMVRYSDGFKIAEEDLRIRGPGEFFGREQHGLSELKIANPLTQMQLLKRAREEAIRLLNLDAHLGAKQNQLLKDKLLQKFPEYEKLMLVG